MSPTTWSRVEHGGRVRELAYSSVDAVLGWRAGACERFLTRGEEPRPVDEPEPSRADGAAPSARSPRPQAPQAPPAQQTPQGARGPQGVRPTRPSSAAGGPAKHSPAPSVLPSMGAARGTASSFPQISQPSLAGGEVREWRAVPTADPEKDGATVVFWIGPPDADMEEVGRALDEQRRHWSPEKEAQAIAAQDRWEALFAREKAEAAARVGRTKKTRGSGDIPRKTEK